MSEDCLVFKLIENKYAVGDTEPLGEDGFSLIHNGVKEECVNTIEHIIIPRTHNNAVVFRLSYRSFRETPLLKTIYIPNTITELNAAAFMSCTNLESVVFEENSKIKQFHMYTFHGTNLAFIDIPKSVTKIDSEALATRSSSLTVFIHSSKRITASQIFGNKDSESINVYAPKNYPDETLLGITIHRELEWLKKISCKKQLLNLNTHKISTFLVTVLLSS